MMAAILFTIRDITPLTPAPQALHLILTLHYPFSMPHITPSPTLDASGVLASRLLDFLASKRPSAQEKLGDRRLDKKNGDWISPSDLKIAGIKYFSAYHLQAYPSYVLSPVSAAEIKAGLESKTGLSTFLQAREYTQYSRESLPKTLSVLSRSLLRITSHREQHFS
jgi:hypothetical protein